MKKLTCPQCRSAAISVDAPSGIAHCQHCDTFFDLATSRTITTNQTTFEDITESKRIDAATRLREKELDFKRQRYEDEKEDRERQRAARAGAKLTKTIVILSLIAFLAVCASIAFIGYKFSHWNDIKYDLSSAKTIGKEYTFIVSKLEDLGFTNISTNVISDLTNANAEQEYLVTSISIDGNTNFISKTWFNKDAKIVITYHELDPNRPDEIRVPGSHLELIGVNYSVVEKMFVDAGFTNVELNPVVDIKLLQSHDSDGEVSEVTINGSANFNKDAWFLRDTRVTISIHCSQKTADAIEAEVLKRINAGKMQVPCKSEKYVGQPYNEVQAALRAVGFTNITPEALGDLDLDNTKQVDKVAAVSIDGITNFAEGDYFSPDAEIIIRYHSPDPVKLAEQENTVQIPQKSAKYIGMDYNSVVVSLTELGFKTITTIALNDLDADTAKGVNTIAEISINGHSEFAAKETFSKDDTVIIKYHTQDPEKLALRQTQIQVPQKASKYEGTVYTDVVDEFIRLGFTNVKSSALNDLPVDSTKKNNQVASVAIDGNTNFKAGEYFSITSEIIVSYHSIDPAALAADKKAREGKCEVTKSSIGFIGMNVSDAQQALEDMGFKNITLVEATDVLSKTSVTAGKVKSISISGDSGFKSGTLFPSDSEVIITYYPSK